MLFLTFIDDLAKVLQRYGITARLFADDVKVYLEITGHEDSRCCASTDGFRCNNYMG